MSLVSAADSNNVFEVILPRLIKFGVNMERIDSDVKVFNDIPFDSVLKIYILCLGYILPSCFCRRETSVHFCQA